jgi:DNA repair exonuclease SbcCD ATPase subunit
MKEVHFKSVFIQNFLSIGENTIEINFHQGITIITGENKDKGGKNGIGKSTIADAIFWCLFGDTIRELKKENIQHNLNKDECCVILKFDIKNSNEVKKYQIKRILNPAKIEILCDDKDVTLSTLPKNDDFIKNLINANQEVFNNAVIMSTNSTVPFMAQKKTEKRKFIEGILQLNIFGEMLLKTRAEYNDLKKENDILSNNFLNQQKNLDIFEKQKEKGEELKYHKAKMNY